MIAPEEAEGSSYLWNPLLPLRGPAELRPFLVAERVLVVGELENARVGLELGWVARVGRDGDGGRQDSSPVGGREVFHCLGAGEGIAVTEARPGCVSR